MQPEGPKSVEVVQKAVVTETEGDAWLARNLPKVDGLAANGADPVVDILAGQDVRAQNILEIGCSNGWRLELLRRALGAAASGIDASPGAIAAGRSRFPALDLVQGTADALPFAAGRFDLVIYGFCLYLCDRADLFRIVAEGDRVLVDGGHLIIYDFRAETPHRRKYQHDARLSTFKMNNPALFLANPAYKLVAQHEMGADGCAAVSDDDRVAVTLLKKSLADAYPLRTG